MTATPPKKSDLGVRVASALVMVAVAGTALWLGGWAWTLFVAAVGFGVLWEWRALVRGFVPSVAGQAAWLFGGLVYIGIATLMLVGMRGSDFGLKYLLMVLFGVIGTDIGAFFAGRTFRGPKIAPSISPSKTWSGLCGGIIGASGMMMLVFQSWDSMLCRIFFPRIGQFGFDGPCNGPGAAPATDLLLQMGFLGLVVAVIAQAGDFFESWMKRRAGVKDSSNLIPGHGGLFDRADGMLAVTFVVGLLQLATRL